MTGKLYQAIDSFAVTIDGAPVVVKKGDLVIGGHPLLKGKRGSALFKEAEPKDYVRFHKIEKATASPGEKRKRTTRRKATTAKAASSSKPSATADDDKGGITTGDVPGA